MWNTIGFIGLMVAIGGLLLICFWVRGKRIELENDDVDYY